MSETVAAHLDDRGIIAVTGEDKRDFLQGIVTNDMNKVTAENAAYGAFLTPQGKYLFDFFMVIDGDTLLIETERARIADFMKRLTMYKLRAKVDLADVSENFDVYAVFGGDSSSAFGLGTERGKATVADGGPVFVDPRLTDAGSRLFLRQGGTLPDGIVLAEKDAYDRHRLALGLPDSSRDLLVEKSTLMESGFDELNGIDWQKGCYMGQEVTARTKHRGLVKKRLVPVALSGATPTSGAAIMEGDRAVGEMRSANGDIGLALIKLDALERGGSLTVDGQAVEPKKPIWATF